MKQRQQEEGGVTTRTNWHQNKCQKLTHWTFFEFGRPSSIHTSLQFAIPSTFFTGRHLCLLFLLAAFHISLTYLPGSGEVPPPSKFWANERLADRQIANHSRRKSISIRYYSGCTTFWINAELYPIHQATD